MKKLNWILREILYRVYEQNEYFMSQKSLTKSCGVSMETVNRLVSRLYMFRSIEKKPLGFRVVSPMKVLAYWSCTRNITKDIVYSTYAPESVTTLEKDLYAGSILTAFTGYRLKFNETPEPYEEVYVYGDPKDISRKFKESDTGEKNLFVLRTDPHLKKVSKDNAPPLAQIYADLWQVGGPSADKLLLELEKKLESKSVDVLKSLLQPLEGTK